jgi:transcriptional regulator with XRE-family HTH domain
MNTLHKLGENIKKAREDSGLTQEQLAKKVGIHVSYVSRIERGVANLSVEVLGSVVKALKVKSSDILPF